MKIRRLTDLCVRPIDASLRRRATRVAGVCVLAFASGTALADGLDWSLRASGVTSGDLRIEGVEAQAAGNGSVSVRASGIELPGLGEWGDLSLVCEADSARCVRGRVERLAADGTPRASATIERDRARIRLVDGTGHAELALEGNRAVTLVDWPIAAWMAAPGLPLVLQGGRLDASMQPADEGIEATFELRGFDFDTAEGRYAGAGLAVAGQVRGSATSLDGRLEWRGGEALLGPAYLPPPPSPIGLDFVLAPTDGDSREAVLRLHAEDWLTVSATASLPLAGTSIAATAPTRVQLTIETIDLARAWVLGPDSLAARAGWSDLEVTGRVAGTVDWSPGATPIVDLDWRAVGVDDPAGRIGVRGLEGGLEFGADRERFAAGFDAATLYRLPIAATRWALEGRDGTLALVEPVRVPLLDGALRIDRLAIERDAEGPPAIDLDAAIEPLDLARLTGALGLPRFGGSVSGRIPGVRLDGETLRVNGGLDLDLFSGQARISGLSVERPFGTLPALSASLEFERLDLAPLTTAFEFGAIEGELSGHIRDLRLLDWEPVAFDAWLYTLTDTAKRRRISQRAVDQIARLGGGSAAALSAPILRLFDDFAYEQIGMGCRLAANVCTMRGLSEVDGGGYRIVAGRGLPRLDVVGFRRRVDWPVLLAQLRAATEGEGVRVGN